MSLSHSSGTDTPQNSTSATRGEMLKWLDANGVSQGEAEFIVEKIEGLNRTPLGAELAGVDKQKNVWIKTAKLGGGYIFELWSIVPSDLDTTDLSTSKFKLEVRTTEALSVDPSSSSPKTFQAFDIVHERVAGILTSQGSGE